MEIIKIQTVVIKKQDLRKLRKKAGLTQRELEKRSGVPFSKISNYENGLRMSEAIWDRISKALDK